MAEDKLSRAMIVGTAHQESLASALDEHFKDLFGSSSLGTPAASRIRAMTSGNVVEDIRRRAITNTSQQPADQPGTPPDTSARHVPRHNPAAGNRVHVVGDVPQYRSTPQHDSPVSVDLSASVVGDGHYLPSTVQRSAKILVVGAFGVGKTTLIGSVSEINPLRTEEAMTTASVGVDDLAGLDEKKATTVAMDFGRVTVTPELVLYLFGTPGQRRFWDLWEGLAEGAVGALVLVDTRRLEQSFEVLDQLEAHCPGLPFAVAVNNFPDSPWYAADELAEALDLPLNTLVVEIDARQRSDVAMSLVTLVEQVLTAHKVLS